MHQQDNAPKTFRLKLSLETLEVLTRQEADFVHGAIVISVPNNTPLNQRCAKN